MPRRKRIPERGRNDAISPCFCRNLQSAKLQNPNGHVSYFSRGIRYPVTSEPASLPRCYAGCGFRINNPRSVCHCFGLFGEAVASPSIPSFKSSAFAEDGQAVAHRFVQTPVCSAGRLSKRTDWKSGAPFPMICALPYL
jgi:hypothetical protein